MAMAARRRVVDHPSGVDEDRHMQRSVTCTAGASFFLLVLLAAACGPKTGPDTTQPNAATTATGYPGYSPGNAPPGYPPPQAQTAPAPYPAAAPAPAPAPTYQQYPPAAPPMAQPPPVPAPAPAASGQMAVPSAIAFQCQNDVPCGLHHCNLQYGRCAFPCVSAADCLAPNVCLAGVCLPAPPQPR
jgi:hypothetical protein